MTEIKILKTTKFSSPSVCITKWSQQDYLRLNKNYEQDSSSLIFARKKHMDPSGPGLDPPGSTNDFLKISDLSPVWSGDGRWEALPSGRDKKVATYHQMKGLLLKLLTNEVLFLLKKCHAITKRMLSIKIIRIENCKASKFLSKSD